MLYFDTSILVPYYCPEEISEKAEEIILSCNTPVISDLVQVELFSAVARKVRERELSRMDADKIISKFISHINGNYFQNEQIASHHYRLARDWLGRFSVTMRTLDAIHLAVASSLDATIITADKQLANAAVKLSVKSNLVK
jgi:predicted nucleic acid-binding protein